MIGAAIPKRASVTEDVIAWNEALLSLDGHLLQSWEWGAFKNQHGWRAQRLVVDANQPRAMAQVLFKHKGPISIGYIPRGPAVAPNDLEALELILQQLDEAARRHRAVSIVIEVDRPIDGLSQEPLAGLRLGPPHIQPGRTVKVPLVDDDALLAQMHQKTRYSVRLAERKGVQVTAYASSDSDALAAFYAMLTETSERNQFGVHTKEYYRSFLEHFQERALLLLATVEGHPAAGVIAARFGPETVYMYGASSAEHRSFGAAFNLQFRAMQWGRGHGALRYDLWGIPEVEQTASDHPLDHVPATRGDDWRGLLRFKSGFGGSVVTYPPTVQRDYHRRLSRLATRMAGHGL